MNESVFAMLNQQFNNGQAFGQQGTFAEMQGNYFVAAQNYDQSIWWIYQSMVMAQQYGVQIPHHIYYAYAFVNFSAARAKSFLGQAPVAFSHLNDSIAVTAKLTGVRRSLDSTITGKSPYTRQLYSTNNSIMKKEGFRRRDLLTPC